MNMSQAWAEGKRRCLMASRYPADVVRFACVFVCCVPLCVCMPPRNILAYTRPAKYFIVSYCSHDSLLCHNTDWHVWFWVKYRQLMDRLPWQMCNVPLITVTASWHLYCPTIRSHLVVWPTIYLQNEWYLHYGCVSRYKSVCSLS